MMYTVYCYGGPHLDQRQENKGQKDDLSEAFKLANKLNQEVIQNKDKSDEKITHFVYDENNHRMPN